MSLSRKLRRGQAKRLKLQGPTVLELRHLQITKSEFAVAPVADRTLYFQLGLLVNEITSFRKIMIYSLNGIQDTHDIEREGRIAMAMLATRFTAGRLYEGYVVLFDQGNGNALSRLIDDAKDDPRSRITFNEGLDAQERIQAYFAVKPNLILLLRNTLAFHSDKKQVEKAFQNIPNDNFVDYLASHNGNTLFGGAEAIGQQIMINLTGTDNSELASVKVRDEVIKLSGLFENYANAFHLAFAAVYAPNALESLQTHRSELKAPKMSSVQLPFFAPPSASDLDE